MRIPPWNMLSGLGTMDRNELCDILAVFRDVSLLNLAKDRLQDVSPFASDDDKSVHSKFHRRLERTSAKLIASEDDDGILRLMLWAEIRIALECPTSVPLSLRSAPIAAADVAQNAAKTLAKIVPDRKGEKAGWLDVAKDAFDKAKSILGFADTPDFGTVVKAQASRLMAKAVKEGLIDETRKKEIIEEFRRRLENLPPEMKTEATKRAIELGDAAGLGLLAGGGALVGVGVAVEVAGFGAYMLAAQASAFIPLVGGKATVSALFVLAHPLFIVPVLAGGGWLVKSRMEKAVKRSLAAGLVVLLTLRGISVGRLGIQLCLNEFRTVEWHPARRALRPYPDHIAKVRCAMDGPLPPAPGAAPGILADPVEASQRADMDRFLFPDPDQKMDVGAVGVLTLGDIVYTVASVDPQVIVAADFSRAEDLADVFRFGAFAKRIGEMSGNMGAENNLRGYVAEQIVAARLVERGHHVSLPETPNNPGYDLLVDGSEFQIKCLHDIDGLAEHFSKYPDIPVIANGELDKALTGSEAVWKDHVFFIEGYDYETTDKLMDDSLEAGEGLLNLDVPIFAIAVSAARNLHGWWKGAIPLADVPYEVAVDGAIKGSLAVAGGLSGKALGLLLFGPAGAVLFGGVGGIVSLFGAGRVKRLFDKTTSPKWMDEVDTASRRFVEALATAICKKDGILNGKLDAIWKNSRPESIWIRNRMLDDKVFLAEASVRIAELRQMEDPQVRARAALRCAHDHAIHPWTVRGEMADLLRTLGERPSMGDKARSIWSCVTSIKGRFQ